MTKSNSYTTKDSGKRAKYDSGMVRDSQENKPDFSLINPLNMPYDETLLYQWAMLMTRGAKKYKKRNWEKANSIEELNRFRASAERHFRQAMDDEDDEAHIPAVLFNLNALFYLMWKLGVDIHGNKRR